MAKRHPYSCPGCDREAFVHARHSSRLNSPHFTIGCSPTGEIESVDPCLGQWFQRFEWETETSAVSAWNQAIIDMGASALGVTRNEALSLKEGRAYVADGRRSPSTGRA